ncbi:MAG: hypothetical protein GY946_21500 [bacterium]|nr:hypothetical protein [bacterium]
MMILLASSTGMIGLGLLFTSFVLFGFALGTPMAEWFAKRRVRAEDFMRRLNRKSPVPLSIYGAPIVGVALLVFFTVAGAWVFGVILGYAAFRASDTLPGVYIRKRLMKFDEQLVDALMTLSNSTKAGMSLPQAVSQVATDGRPPISEEFGRIARDYDRGRTIEQSLEDARERINSRNFDLAVRAFRVGLSRGGNISEVFEKIAGSIREIWRLEEHIRTVTTEGRSSARFMSVMPFVFLILGYFMDPEGMKLMFTTTIGLVLLTIVIVMNLLANLWIRRILNVDV